MTLKVRGVSVTSRDLGRQTSTQIEAGYECALPQEPRGTRAPQHSLFPNPGQTRVPRAASLPLAAPPTGLSRTGPAGNQGHVSSHPPPHPSNPAPEARVGACKSWPTLSPRLCPKGKGGGLERRDFPGPFSWHLSRSKNFFEPLTKGGGRWSRGEKLWWGGGGGYVVGVSSFLL